MNHSPQERLARLEEHRELVAQRDDLMVEYITLLNIQERYAQALALLNKHHFHPWEGGEGKVPAQYVWGLVGQARQLMDKGQFAEALQDLEQACCYPDNLGEGKLHGTQENHVHYWTGCVFEALGDQQQAVMYFQKAASGLSEPTSAMFYNDQPPDMIFYQGLARQKLGQSSEAAQIFQRLVDFGRQHINDEVQMDYFAVSLPDFLVFEDDLTQRNRIHCHYMMALGYLGLGDQSQARSHFEQVLATESNHFGAHVHRQFLDAGQV
jgi:tetratricopeptide (TPR) repeat protein